MKSLIILTLLCTSACSGTNFAGSKGPKQNSTGAAGANGETGTNGSRGADVPSDAITKGNFTVWTVPQDPLPKQPYRIVIEVNLPTGTTNYVRTDLSGTVTGTDGYRRKIEEDDIPPQIKSLFGSGNVPFGGDTFENVGNKARLYLNIPGGQQLVKDTVVVRSALLNEQQSISIVF